MKKPTKKKNAQDSTLRNVRAAQKKNAALSEKLSELTAKLENVESDVFTLKQQVYWLMHPDEKPPIELDEPQANV